MKLLSYCEYCYAGRQSTNIVELGGLGDVVEEERHVLSTAGEHADWRELDPQVGPLDGRRRVIRVPRHQAAELPLDEDEADHDAKEGRTVTTLQILSKATRRGDLVGCDGTTVAVRLVFAALRDFGCISVPIMCKVFVLPCNVALQLPCKR